MQTEFLITKLVPAPEPEWSWVIVFHLEHIVWAAGEKGSIVPTHRHRALLHIVGVRKLGYVGEKRGAIQRPGVAATGNLKGWESTLRKVVQFRSFEGYEMVVTSNS